MRIPCPFCGERDSGEFVYRGDASLARPSDDAGFHDYVYLRTNPAGPIEEHWYHAQGCRNWIIVARDTRSHAIEISRLASERAR
jgi:heterotetrameric sarcosine oxidase delta subunit